MERKEKEYEECLMKRKNMYLKMSILICKNDDIKSCTLKVNCNNLSILTSEDLYYRLIEFTGDIFTLKNSNI